MGTDERKRALRKDCREKRLSAAQREAASRAIAERVLSHPAYRAAKTVFVFVGMPGEPDTAPLIDGMLREGKRVCVPRCGRKPRMDAAAIRSRAELHPGALGIPEPPPKAAAVPPDEIDLALIPCVAAGRDGSRLGHGGGYYDAYLAGAGMRRICLCFEALLREDIPMAAADQRMDEVITEKAVYAGKEDGP